MKNSELIKRLQELPPEAEVRTEWGGSNIAITLNNEQTQIQIENIEED